MSSARFTRWPNQVSSRIADGVDAAAVVGEIDAECALVPGQRRPERIARRDRPAKQLVGQRPRARAGFIERRPAPAVRDELDVVALRSFRRGRAFRPQRLEIGILRRKEGQRPIVEHDADDDRAPNDAAVTDRATGLRHVPFTRAERQHFFEHLPVAAACGLVSRRRVLRQVQRKAADERSVGGVQLDSGGQTIAREVGVQPHG